MQLLTFPINDVLSLLPTNPISSLKFYSTLNSSEKRSLITLSFSLSLQSLCGCLSVALFLNYCWAFNMLSVSLSPVATW